MGDGDGDNHVNGMGKWMGKWIRWAQQIDLGMGYAYSKELDPNCC